MKKNRIDIDLFSDTKTRPSQEMREYIFRAEVGDEQSDEDPTTIELCERVAGLLGKERALFLPSGTMCNQIALAVHCGPGDEVIADETAHIINFEVGGAASTAGAMVRAIKGENGIFTAADVEGSLRQGFRHMPKSRLVVIEQTSNLGGGTIWPIRNIEEIEVLARSSGLGIHMDGARLMNAVVASQISASDYAKYTDSVWIDLSKGLGCPIGGVLAGSHEFIEKSWLWKQRLGGSMRQSGMMAAAGIFALDNNIERLEDDHKNARSFAKKLSAIKGIEINPSLVETNIVICKVVSEKISAKELVTKLSTIGIRIGALTERELRIVTHLDVNEKQIEKAVEEISKIMLTA